VTLYLTVGGGGRLGGMGGARGTNGYHEVPCVWSSVLFRLCLSQASEILVGATMAPGSVLSLRISSGSADMRNLQTCHSSGLLCPPEQWTQSQRCDLFLRVQIEHVVSKQKLNGNEKQIPQLQQGVLIRDFMYYDVV
jgi:hypothetical protein